MMIAETCRLDHARHKSVVTSLKAHIDFSAREVLVTRVDRFEFAAVDRHACASEQTHLPA
jgi:hypothetical protein